MKKINIIIFICSILLFACSTKEEYIDNTPIKILTLPVAEIQPNSVMLQAEIGYLNDEKVIEYGFILKQNDNSTSKIIILGNKPNVGIVKHKVTKTFKIGENYAYALFIKTSKQQYQSSPKFFTVNDIWVDNSKILYASPQDEINITGRFKQIDDSLKLLIKNSYSTHEVPFVLDSNKEKMTFTIPNIEMYHGEELSIILSNNRNNINFEQLLINLKVAARISGPVLTQNKYYEPIKLTGIALPKNYGSWNGDFYFIIADKVLKYGNQYYPHQLGLEGSSYKLGYVWGKDTIYINETYDIAKPDLTNVSLKEKIIHPFSYTMLEGLDYAEYVAYMKSKITIGQYQGEFVSDNYNRLFLKINDIPNGNYSVTLNNNVFGEHKLKENLTVEKLNIKSISNESGYYEDPIIIKGNFQPNIEYIVSTDDYNVFTGFPINEELHFPISHVMGKGNVKLRIGYKISSMEYKFVNESNFVTVKGLSIDSFSPSKVSAGDIVTVKGRGIKSANYPIQIGIKTVIPFYVSDGELKFVVPTFQTKGKTKIIIQGFESNDYLEIL